MIPISVDAVETVDELQGKKLQNIGQVVEILVSVVSVPPDVPIVVVIVVVVVVVVVAAAVVVVEVVVVVVGDDSVGLVGSVKRYF